MTDVDRMTPAERELRDELQRSLVPPSTPASLRAAVEELAASPPAALRATRPDDAWARNRFGFAVLATAAALIVGVLFVLPLGLADRVGTTPPPPSLPAIVLPALPSSPPNPTTLAQAQWIDAESAWSVDAANRLRITTDGGQTWSEPRTLPAPTDLGLEFQDAMHGTTAWIVEQPDHTDLNVYTTDDGGATWATSPVASYVGNWGGAYANVHFEDRDRGAFTTTLLVDGQPDECAGYTTDDRGASAWAGIMRSPCIGVGGTTWADGLTGVARTIPPFDGIALTVDGGRTWTMTSLPNAAVGQAYRWLALTGGAGQAVRLVTVPMPDGVAGPLPVAVFETTDNGYSWHEAYRSDARDGIDIQGLHAFDANHWLATVDGNTTPRLATLDETFDGGRTWSTFAGTGLSVGTPLSFSDRLHGTVQGVRMEGDCQATGCGGTGTVWFTNDGGLTWHGPPF